VESVQTSLAEYGPTVTARRVGGGGGNVTATSLEEAEQPTRLHALTENVYEVKGVSPVTAKDLVVTVVIFVASRYTSKERGVAFVLAGTAQLNTKPVCETPL
jgi:tripartite-type tricarboxylate transporter receptor subunit TctC